MRTTVAAIGLLSLPFLGVSALSRQAAHGCSDVEKTAREYIAQNFSDDDEKSPKPEQKITRLNASAAAVELLLPPREDEKEPHKTTLFFAGKTSCEFAYQADGEITEILEAGATRYVFVRHEHHEGEENVVEYQVLKASVAGEVSPARDQHGGEIYFEEAMQKRCEGKAGHVTKWSRDEKDARRIILRQRHTERDGKCRVTEDSSNYRYYRLTAEHWELDDGDAEAIAEEHGQNSPPVVHLKTPARKR